VTPRTFFVLTFLIGAAALIAHAQTLSPDGSSITPSSGGSLLTADGTWTFGTATVAWGTAILLNGQLAANGYANELLISGGKLYEDVGGSAPGWWYWQNGAWVQTTAPQTSGGTGGGTSSCTGTLTNYYQPSIATPTGYGASYDLFTSQHELEVSVQNCPANSTTLTVGSNQSNQYIYNKGYLYQSSTWQPITLTSNSSLVSNAWYTGTAQANLSINPTSWTYVVGYVCAWNGTVWQCGCASTACSTSYWQLQAFQSPQSSGGGSNGSGQGGQWGGQPDANAIVISPSGSDSNPCNVNSPCQTLEKAQQVAQGASDKTIYLRAGTYNRSGTLNLGSSDNGETWQTYPSDAVDSAVITGGDNVAFGINMEGVSNVTINGLSVQHFITGGIRAEGASSNVLIENNDVGHITDTSYTPSFGIDLSDAPHSTVSHNYVHDTTGPGIDSYAYYAGQSADGDVITGNVLLNDSNTNPDTGAIYLNMHATDDSGGHITVSNNYVRDWGSSVGNQHAVYLDDQACDVTITGNVLGAPQGVTGSNYTGTGMIFANGGNNNTISGNIIDLGNSGHVVTVNWSQESLDMSGNSFTGNIVVSSYTGTQQIQQGATGGSYSFVENGSLPASDFTIQNNLYHNYAGGQVNTSGNITSDAHPIMTDPQISGYLYNMAGGSPAFSAPINFSSIQGGWGPPGFVIPSSSNHSDP
jgi:hypothetical protein